MTSVSLVDSVLQSLEAQEDRLSQNWCVSRETGRFLGLMVRLVGAKSVLEIGTSIGYSTLWLAQALEGQGGRLETIDFYPSRQEIAKEHVQQADLVSIVSFLQGDALTVIAERVGQGVQYDMVFIDAAKQQYLAYLKALEPSLMPGALIVADNTRSHREPMLDFLAYVETGERYQVAELETPSGQLMVRYLGGPCA